MQKIEQTVSSIEASDMMDKTHKDLLRDIRRYCEQLGQGKIPQSDFFRESTYKDSIGRTLPCYRITKKGCEFIAHKLTGVKGTIFTARYINRFHEMEEKLSHSETDKPWFIRKFRGDDIILWRDFASITGYDIERRKPRGWSDFIKGGRDFNGYGWKCDHEQFRKKHGFDYGEEPCMTYFYLCGIRKVLWLIKNEHKFALPKEAETLLLDAITHIVEEKIPRIEDRTSKTTAPIQIIINMEPEKMLSVR